MVSLSKSRRATLSEQAVVAITGFLSMLVFARNLPPAEWAIVSFAAAMVLVMQGMQLSIVILPMISLSQGNLSAADQINWTWINRVLLIASMVILAISGFIVLWSGSSWIGTSLIYATLMIPPAFTYEYLRRRLILSQKYTELGMIGLSYAFGVALSLGAQSLFSLPPIFVAVTYWPGVLLAVYLSGVRDPFRRSAPAFSWLKPLKAFAPWAMGGSIAMIGYNFAVLAMLGSLSGANAVAAFSATRLLIQPVNTIIGAFNSLDLPNASKAFASGFRALVRVQARSALRLVIIGGVYVALIAGFSSQVLALLFEGRYTDGHLVQSWAIVGFLMLVTTPVENLFYVTRQPHRLLLSRVSASAIGCGLAYALIPQYEAVGAILSIATGWAVVLIGSLAVMWFANRKEV